MHMFCPCGKEISDDCKKCPHCGHSFEEKVTPDEEKKDPAEKETVVEEKETVDEEGNCQHHRCYPQPGNQWDDAAAKFARYSKAQKQRTVQSKEDQERQSGNEAVRIQ